MIILIDNYDSFTYNLYQLLKQSGADVEVCLNDKQTVAQIIDSKPEGIVLSPGPGGPKDSGVCLPLINHLARGDSARKIPVLGVCLGHQVIASAFGGNIIKAPQVVHGKADAIFHRRYGLFNNLPMPFSAARYHSLVCERSSFPKELNIDAESPDGLIMALSHKSLPLYGVQFHPESILTNIGELLIKSFLNVCSEVDYVERNS